MPADDGTLPEWVAARIDPATSETDLPQRHVAAEFVHGDRPYYSVSQMHAALGSDVGQETVAARLAELVERGVLATETVNDGAIYWLENEASEWPIPPDVAVESTADAVTLAEWREQLHVRIAAAAVLIAITGTAITLVGAFQAAGRVGLPVDANVVIGLGVAGLVLGLIVLVYAGVFWVYESPAVTVDRIVEAVRDR